MRKFLTHFLWKLRDNCSGMVRVWLMFGFLPNSLFQRYAKTHPTLRKSYLNEIFFKCPKWGMSILRFILPASPTGWQAEGVSFLHSGDQSMLPHLQKSKLSFTPGEGLSQECPWLCHQPAAMSQPLSCPA